MLVQHLGVQADDADQTNKRADLFFLEEHVDATIADRRVNLTAYFVQDVQ